MKRTPAGSRPTDRIRRRAVLASATAIVLAFAAAATVGPPAGYVDTRPKICGGAIRWEDCFGGPLPTAWNEAPAIWFVVAAAIALVIALGLWLAPASED